MTTQSKLIWADIDPEEPMDWSTLPILPSFILKEDTGFRLHEPAPAVIETEESLSIAKEEPKRRYDGRVIAKIFFYVNVRGHQRKHWFYLIAVKNSQKAKVGAKRILASQFAIKETSAKKLHWNKKDRSKKLCQRVTFIIEKTSALKFPFNKYGCVNAYNMKMF